MPRCGRMPLHIDLEQYLTLPGLVRAEFDGWLEDEGLIDQHCVSLTLGEGVVTVVRYAKDDKGEFIVDGDELVMTTDRFRVRSLPPGVVWEHVDA